MHQLEGILTLRTNNGTPQHPQTVCTSTTALAFTKKSLVHEPLNAYQQMKSHNTMNMLISTFRMTN